MIVDIDLRREGWLARFRTSGPARVIVPSPIGVAPTTRRGQAAIDALRWIAAGRSGAILIHGYNSPEANVRAAYKTITDRMQSAGLYHPERTDLPYKFVLQVFWPGRSTTGYHLAELAAEGLFLAGAGDRLHDLLTHLAGRGGVCWRGLERTGDSPLCATKTTLDLIMHSAGNRVGCDANRKADLPIRHMLMCAAALNHDACSLRDGHKPGEFFQAVSGISGQALIFHSRGDGVLAKAYRVAKLSQALGCAGPAPEPPPNVRAIDANAWIRDHSEFRDRQEFYDAWSDLVRPDHHAPAQEAA